MSIFALIAAFGGGVVGAYLGALPAFILTGVVALVGGAITMAGAADMVTGLVAFGSFLGPHIAFAGGVAASAFAARKKELASGTDITSSLNGLGDPAVICVGGIFGVIGFLINYVLTLPAVINVFPTDTPGCTVFISAVIVRLFMGKSGLTGKYTESGKRVWFATGKGFAYNLTLGLGIGVVCGGIVAYLTEAGLSTASFNIVCFGIAATSLIFTQTGFATPATHHIFLPASTAAMTFAVMGTPVALVAGIAFGILGSLLGDLFGRTFNSYCDTHIDPPATTIFILIAVIGWLGKVIA